MQSIAEGAYIQRSAALVMLCAALIGAMACSKTPNPTTPEPPGGPYIGTWKGTVTSDVIGSGNATIVFDGGFKTPSVFQVTGRWNFEFPEARFSAGGTVSGSALTNASLFVLVFSSATVPCPETKDGVDVKGRSASVTLTSDRMQGSYIANGCPGGTIDLTRR